MFNSSLFNVDPTDYQLRMEAIDISLKKLDLKFGELSKICTDNIATILNLLIKKGIITNEEFDEELQKIQTEGTSEIAEILDKLRKEVEEKEKEYNKKLEEYKESIASFQKLFGELNYGENKDGE
jgi:hypothetical protein